MPSTPRRKRIRRFLVGGVVLLPLLVGVVGVAYALGIAFVLTHRPHNEIKGSPADYGATVWHNVTFTTSDGLKLVGWYIPPTTDKAALVLVAGQDGSRKGNGGIARLLIREGYGVLMYDSRGTGASAGHTVSMGCNEVKDVQAAFAYLAAQPEVDPTRIGLYGHSMGAGTVMRAMARIPQARVLIESSGFTSIETVMHDGTPALFSPMVNLQLWFGSQMTDCDLSAVRPIEDIAKISPRPILFLHGTADETIHFQQAERLFAAAGEPKEFYAAEGAGHSNVYAINRPEYERRVLEFLNTYLRQ